MSSKSLLVATAVLVSSLLCDDASALTIYRFGGDDLPPPAEVENSGVEFIQRSWLEPVNEELGGGIYQLDLSDRTIRALEFDPTVNMAPTAKARGEGVRESTRQIDQEKAVDGDLFTAWKPAQYLCAKVDTIRVGSEQCAKDTDYLAAPAPYFLGAGRRFISGGYGLGGWTFGLGGLLFVDKVRIISGVEGQGAIMRNFKILAAAGSTPDPQGSIQFFNEIAEIRGNQQEILDIPFPRDQRVDFISILYAEHKVDWAVNEVEVYASGFVEQAFYVSEIIEFDNNMAWGELSWSGNQEPGAEVRIHTRSGNTADQSLYWQLNGIGEKIPVEDEGIYRRLKLGQRGGTTYDIDNWTFWSVPYDLADSLGTPVVSLGPRKFFQFKLDLLPGDLTGAEINFLELRASEPLASSLIGEVSPAQAQVAESSGFTYYLRPLINSGESGFDGLEMTSTSIINEVSALRIGEQDWPFEVKPMDAHGAELSGFPAHRFELTLVDTMLAPQDSGTLVEIDFEARVLRSGSAFDLRVFDTRQPLEVRQQVAAGDADNLIEGNTVSVTTTANASTLLRVDVSTAIFTPNDDQVNDVVTISYDLLEITSTAAISVEISDLAGRVVREIFAGEASIGHYEREWDGADDAGKVVPPGVYLYSVRADTDQEQVSRLGVVNVAY